MLGSNVHLGGPPPLAGHHLHPQLSCNLYSPAIMASIRQGILRTAFLFLTASK
jgi:hypothetical protein